MFCYDAKYDQEMQRIHIFVKLGQFYFLNESSVVQ